MTKTLGDIRRAKILGADLGETTRIITDLEESVRNIQSLILSRILPVFNVIASGITTLVELLESLVRYFLGEKAADAPLDPILSQLADVADAFHPSRQGGRAGRGRTAAQPLDPDVPAGPRR
jgi:hypothetical protein